MFSENSKANISEFLEDLDDVLPDGLIYLTTLAILVIDHSSASIKLLLNIIAMNYL